jgi:capsule polysaccharide export protein KpsC/LpsZ
MPLVRNEIKRIASFNYTVKRSWTKLQQLAADFRRSGDLSQVSYHFQDLISRYFKRRRTLARDRALVKVYKAKACAPDLNQDFIYVALHYQPECTTCPMGGAFVDQYLMIDILAKSIPRTMRLYVKEHPVQRSNGRSVQFYEDILKLPNVYLVSQETSTFDLIRNAFAVATVTGTVGWESLFFMKPVLMFGEFFYKHAIGVFQIKDIKAAKQAIAHIHAGVKPTQQSMRCLLLAIQRICVRGYSIAEYEPYAGVPKEKNATVLAGALINRLSTDASSR